MSSSRYSTSSDRGIVACRHRRTDRSIVKRQKETRVLLADVTGVNADQRRVLLSDGTTLDYDFLVIATGARHGYFGRDEWAEHAPGIKTLDDATRVRRNILLAMERAETIRQESLPDRDEYLTFVVVGGGPTGVEMAGAIAELTRHATDMDFRFITRVVSESCWSKRVTGCCRPFRQNWETPPARR